MSWHKLVMKFLAVEKDRFGRKPGEQLWKERFPDEKVEEIKQIVGSYYFSGMYQQEPLDEKSALFKRENFKYYEDKGDYIAAHDKFIDKNFLQNYIVVDPAFSDDSSADNTAIMHFLISQEGEYFIDDILTGKYRAGRLKYVIKNFYYKHKSLKIFIEEVAAQKFLLEEIIELGLPASGLKANFNKEFRAIPASSKMENGKIFIKKADWNQNFESELLSFPNGKNDDQVDCLGYAVQFNFRNLSLPKGIKKRRNFDDLY